ncbi:MAG: glycerol-3-phosphate 1-O-acyltransferase PlsY [Candidatus Omnitrophota bacterium]
MLWIIAGIIISYLIGSIPTAYIFGRLLKGIDIRKFGSGNVGATNALRVLGKKAGAIVLILDLLKGFVAVFLAGNWVIARALSLNEEIIRVLFGVASIAGHNWTIFLNFKGGKGVAATFGVILGLAMAMPGLRMVFLLLLVTWLVIFLIFRIVSIASIGAAVSLPLYMVFFHQSATLVSLSFILAAFIILRHKSNLKRFLEGKEGRSF